MNWLCRWIRTLIWNYVSCHCKGTGTESLPRLNSPLSPLGTTVMAIRAFDADDPGTDNAALRYNIVRQSPDNPSSRMFYIDAENGYIITAISPALLDREVS